MILTQYYIGCLSHGSYLIADESSGQAVVVDPRRDIQQYLDDAAASGLRIVGVINTHFHADFVAGHLELAAATGAWIGYGRRAEADYPIRRLADHERIPLGGPGGVELEILETPGHTWESISVLVREHSGYAVPHAVLTGDALFIGDVGRPDLAAAVGASPVELAHALYRSIHEVLMQLPDAVRLLPAHGAGSACGKNLSDELESTIGAQRFMNPSVAPMPEDDFVAMITSGQPAIPRYFAEDAMLNRQVHPLMSRTTTAAPVEPQDARALIARGATVLDTRAPEDFAPAHLAGSVNVGIDGRFAETAGMVVGLGDDVLIVADPGREDEVAMRLGRIGIDRVLGYLAGGASAFADLPQLVRSAERIEAAELDRAAAERDAVILDVRNPGEREAGFVPGSVHIPLAELPARLGELPAGRDVIVHCASGWRSSVAASLLRARDTATAPRRIADLRGGYNEWARSRATASV